MPLRQGSSNRTRQANIEQLISEGYDPQQAEAIGYSVQRRTGKKSALRLAMMDMAQKAFGGEVGNPHHDNKGRFTSGGGASSALTTLPGPAKTQHWRPGDQGWNKMESENLAHLGAEGDQPSVQHNLLGGRGIRSQEELLGTGAHDVHFKQPPQRPEPPKAHSENPITSFKPKKAPVLIPHRDVGPKSITGPMMSRPRSMPSENTKPGTLPEWTNVVSHDTTQMRPRLKEKGQVMKEWLQSRKAAQEPKQAAPKSGKLKLGDKRDVANAITALSPSGFRGNKVQLESDERVSAKNNIKRRIGELNISDEDKAHLRDRLSKLKALAEIDSKLLSELIEEWAVGTAYKWDQGEARSTSGQWTSGGGGTSNVASPSRAAAPMRVAAPMHAPPAQHAPVPMRAPSSGRSGGQSHSGGHTGRGGGGKHTGVHTHTGHVGRAAGGHHAGSGGRHSGGGGRHSASGMGRHASGGGRRGGGGRTHSGAGRHASIGGHVRGGGGHSTGRRHKNDNGDTTTADGPTLNGPSTGNDKQFGIFSSPGARSGRLYGSPSPVRSSGIFNRNKTGVTIHKNADGSRMMFLVTSNSYKDRDNETVTTKALSDYVTKAWGGNSFAAQPLYFWHDDSLPAIGSIIWADMEGPFLIEVAKERTGNPFARTVWDFIERNPRMRWGASHGFDYLKGIEGGAGVYKAIRKFETSVLPLKAAANPYTFATVLAGSDMNTKDALLDKMLGAPGATARLRKGVKQIKHRLDEAGMVPRAKQANVEPTLQEIVGEVVERSTPNMNSKVRETVVKGILDDLGSKIDDILSEFYDEPPEGLNQAMLELMLSGLTGGEEGEPDGDEGGDGMDYMDEEQKAAYMAAQAPAQEEDGEDGFGAEQQPTPNEPPVLMRGPDTHQVARQHQVPPHTHAPSGAPVPVKHGFAAKGKPKMAAGKDTEQNPAVPVGTEEKAQDGYEDEGWGEDTGWVEPELSSGAAIKKPTYVTQTQNRVPGQKSMAEQHYKGLQAQMEQILKQMETQNEALGEVAEIAERVDRIEARKTWLPRQASNDPSTAISDDELVKQVKGINDNFNNANDPFWGGR